MGVYIPAADKLTTELQTEIADLRQVDPRVGLFRFVTIGAIVLSLTALAWSASDIRAFVGITAITGIFYAFWMLCSHDMVHQTLTGWSWFETIAPRLTTLPMCWPYGTYRNLDTYPWIGWLMGGLDYHAVHHAFPEIPFVGVASPVENRLPAAFVGGSGAFALAIASPLGESHSGSFTTAQFATDDSG